MDFSNLAALSAIIAENVSAIERLATQQKTAYPSMDEAYNASSPGEKMTIQPEVLKAALLATSAASQLIASLQLPGLYLFERATGFHISSALRIASESFVVEILREAGPDGMHVSDIAAKTGVDGPILGRSLRLLATHYIFRELKPDVFANNRISSMMDTKKTSTELVALTKKRMGPGLAHGVNNVQGEKYAGTDGISALVEQCTDEVFKASAYIPDVVFSGDFSKTAFQRAFQVDGSMWEFFEKYPGYLQRIQMAMVGFISTQPQQVLFKGFDWATLPKGSLVVDVGGGNGSEALKIIQSAPHVKVVVEDREETLKQVTVPTWSGNPEQKGFVDSGRVSFQAQDFFESQPASINSHVTMFHLRFITHDWAAPECIKILRQLHAAGSKSTKIMLVDQLVPYACPVPESLSFEGVKTIDAPRPLLANLGAANPDVYITDFTMAATLNSQERTIGEFEYITREGGWKIEKVYQTLGSSLSQIVCVKV